MTLAQVKKAFPDSTIETLDGFDSAILGYDLTSSKEGVCRLVYSSEIITKILQDEGMPLQNIPEYILFSVLRDSDTLANFPIVVF